MRIVAPSSGNVLKVVVEADAKKELALLKNKEARCGYSALPTPPMRIMYACCNARTGGPESCNQLHREHRYP